MHAHNRQKIRNKIQISPSKETYKNRWRSMYPCRSGGMKKPRPGYPEAWLFRTGIRLEPGFLQIVGNIADGTDHCTEIGTGQCHVRGQNVGNAAEIKAAFTAEQAAQEIIETQPAENVA